MKVGFLGLGKLGLPVALCVEEKGHQVAGHDISPSVIQMITDRTLTYEEHGAQELLDKTQIKLMEVPELVAFSDIIFVPIQTPHAPLYEGTTRLPDTRVDFDYEWLKSGLTTLSAEIEKQCCEKIVVIVSTVLPGTLERDIIPLLHENVKLCYNPFFIAMGTTIPDFLNPEFVLFGVDDPDAANTAEAFYRTIHDRPFFKTTIKSAELIKVAYNTFIGMKIVFANTMMEICHHTGADVDAVTEAMGLATDRLMSTRYLSGGMGDGGGCHPRDNIALSWLSRKLKLSHDFFDDLMLAREHQTEWLADLMEIEWQRTGDLDYVILGRTFKPETNITTGSPAILLENILTERGFSVMSYDPYLDESLPEFPPSIFLIGTKHPQFQTFSFPVGSVVIDPWRYIPEQEGVEVISLGKGALE
jgi:UDPglucose 6-dehydrogenase